LESFGLRAKSGGAEEGGQTILRKIDENF